MVLNTSEAGDINIMPRYLLAVYNLTYLSATPIQWLAANDWMPMFEYTN